MLNTLKELCALSGVSSWEDEARAFIRAQAEPYADSIRTDAMGNLIMFKKGRKATGNRLLLSAHMDEVGLMITRVEDDGTLRFDSVGGIDRRVLMGKRVYVGPHRIPAVIGSKPIHLTTKEERRSVPKMDRATIWTWGPKNTGSGGKARGAGRLWRSLTRDVRGVWRRPAEGQGHR